MTHLSSPVLDPDHTPSRQSGENLVELDGITKSFGSTHALKGVNLTIRGGEVVGLVGENGAGKSTLIKVLAGVYRHDAGRVVAAGDEVNPGESHDSIAFVHQDLALVPSMSVAENIALQAGFERAGPLISWKTVEQRAARILAELDIDINPQAILSELSSAERSLVAILRAVSRRASVLVLDEPTATLSANESRWLLEVLMQLRDRGVGMLYVSHYLDEVLEISDRVVVLRDGRVVLTADKSGTDVGRLSIAITGKDLAELTERTTSSNSEVDAPSLVTKDLVTDRCGPVSVKLLPGRVNVLTGLVGAGQHRFIRAVVGAAPCYRGQVEYSGVTDHKEVSRDFIAFTSGNRSEESIAPGLSVRENLTPTLSGIHKPRGMRADALETLRRFAVRPLQTELEIDALSGGNQQKVVLARSFESARPLLVLEDPTNGVDIGAKVDIYAAIADVAAAGKVVVVATSDFEEAATIGDVVWVLRDGRVAARLVDDQIDAQRILNIATGEQP